MTFEAENCVYLPALKPLIRFIDWNTALKGKVLQPAAAALEDLRILNVVLFVWLFALEAAGHRKTPCDNMRNAKV